MEWFPEWWGVALPYGNDTRTAAQYLTLRFDKRDDRGVYWLDGIKGITLEQFKAMDIDIVIGTIPQHIDKYTNLIKQFKPNAKFIYQVGNHFGDVNFRIVKNFLSSTSPVKVPKGVNAVFYHQEFDLNIFNYEPPKEGNLIRSFVHTLSTQGHFRDDWQAFLNLEKGLPEFKFESYGASCRDGCVMGAEKMAEMMKESKFGFNLKYGGDGYGHAIHNWFAVGRPPIVKREQYQGKLAGKLMIDGATCINFTNLKSTIERIKNITPEKYLKMCEQAHAQFKKIVDFDKEEQMIKSFLERLI